MALSSAAKTLAVKYLDDNIPEEQSLAKGKYVQVLEFNIDGHAIALDEYVGPLGVGFIRRVKVVDPDDDTIIHRYSTHYGPENRVTGWLSYSTEHRL